MEFPSVVYNKMQESKIQNYISITESFGQISSYINNKKASFQFLLRTSMMSCCLILGNQSICLWIINDVIHLTKISIRQIIHTNYTLFNFIW